MISLKRGKSQIDDLIKAGKNQADDLVKAAKGQIDDGMKAAKGQIDDGIKAAKGQADDAAKAAAGQSDDLAKAAAKQGEQAAEKAVKPEDAFKQARKNAEDFMEQQRKAAQKEADDLIQRYRGRSKKIGGVKQSSRSIYARPEAEQRIARMNRAKEALDQNPRSAEAKQAYENAVQEVQKDKHAIQIKRNGRKRHRQPLRFQYHDDKRKPAPISVPANASPKSIGRIRRASLYRQRLQ